MRYLRTGILNFPDSLIAITDQAAAPEPVKKITRENLIRSAV